MDKKLEDTMMGSENSAGKYSPVGFSDDFSATSFGSSNSFDLLGSGIDFYNPLSSLFDLVSTTAPLLSSPASTVPESSEVVNAPPTPNSSSVSSYSNDAAAIDEVDKNNTEKPSSSNV